MTARTCHPRDIRFMLRNTITCRRVQRGFAAVLFAAIGLSLGSVAVEPAAIAAPSANEGGAGSASAAVPVKCERRFVYSRATHGCVRADSGLVGDTELYEQGRALALTGHYASALDALEAISGEPDRMALTMLGYAQRKLGRYAEGIATYRRALAIDANNADAREYLGETFVEIGRPDLARAELTRIETICGNRTCEQYRDLDNVISGKDEDELGRGVITRELP